jgi:signal transduction histidine kinase
MRYLAASRRWYEDYNITQSTIIGMSHYEVFPDIPERWKAIHQECLRGANKSNRGEVFNRQNGDHQWIAWEIQPWQLDIHATEPDGIIIFSENLTKLYHAQNAESTLRVKMAVDDAMAKASEQALRAKDRFISNLAHEIRAPLNTILGWLQLLRKHPSAVEKLPATLEIMEQNAWHLSSLVSDTLHMNRIITKKLRINRSTVDANECIQKAVEATSPYASSKNISVCTKTSDTAITVYADAPLLQQALKNIIKNAVKFTPDQGSITVETLLKDSTLIITISDTGTGIAAEEQSQIFNRYSQLHGSDSNTGLGLGLAIAKYIIEAHGGTIAVHSDGPNLGSTFFVHIPIETVSTSGSH